MSELDAAKVEQTKLLANALDRASTACFTVGIATPVAAMLYGFVSLGIKLAFLSYIALPVGSCSQYSRITWRGAY